MWRQEHWIPSGETSYNTLATTIQKAGGTFNETGATDEKSGTAKCLKWSLPPIQGESMRGCLFTKGFRFQHIQITPKQCRAIDCG